MHAHSSLDLLVLRSRLVDAQEIPGISDQIAFAELCLAQGQGDQARTLYETAFILQGASRQAQLVQAEAARRTGLWSGAVSRQGHMPPPAGAGTVEIAIAELKSFARMLSGRKPDASSAPAAEGEPAAAGAADPGDTAEIVTRLYTFLRDPAPVDGWHAADRLLCKLREAASRGAALDYRGFHAAPLPLLVAVMSFVGLREFVLDNQDLLSGACGSAEILHRAARFDSVGLGPYLGNVAQLAKRSRDIFELAGIAAAAAGEGDKADIYRWVVILSQHLKGELRNEVVDDLGDLAASAALGVFYDRAVRQPDHRIEIDLVFRLRDAALDIGDLDLARRAQAVVVRLRPEQPLERVILGSIEGTAGLISAAEQNFLECLRVTPDFTDAAERLVALRRHEFGPYRVRQGFGTPEDRALRRRGRRDKAGPAVRAVPRRTVAVEL